MWDLMMANAVDENVEDEVAPPAAVAPGKRTLTQAFAGLGLPDFGATGGRGREQVVELAYKFKVGGHELTVSGQLKLRHDGVSVSAKGTPPATDVSAQGKLTALSLQRKWYQEFSRGAGAKRTQDLLGRLTLSAIKPGASLDGLLPGVKVAVGGDLGQLRLENGLPSVNLGAITLTVTGDVTQWLMGDDAKRLGAKLEIVAKVALAIAPDDVRRLAAMLRAAERLARVGKRAEAVADRARKVALRRKQLELAITRARKLGPRGARTLARAQAKLRKVIKLQRAMPGRVRAFATVLRRLEGELATLRLGLRTAAGKLAARVIATTAFKVLATAMKSLNAVLLVLDLIDLGRFAVAAVLGSVRPKLGGGGSGFGTINGTTADGNSTTTGDDDAVGGGEPDGGVSGEDGGGEDGSGGEGEGDAGEDAADPDAVEAPSDDEPAVAARGGGPGAGQANGEEASYLDEPRDDAPAGATGTASTPIAVDSAGADADAPVPLIAQHPTAARLLAAVHGAGATVTQPIVDALDALVPDDLTDAELAALAAAIAARPGLPMMDEDGVIAALAHAVAEFLAKRQAAREDAGGSGGGGGGGGGGGVRGDATAGGGAAGGGRRRFRPRVGGGGSRVVLPPKPKQAGAKRRKVGGGHGLTPTYYADGNVMLTSTQAARWCKVVGDRVVESDEGRRWNATVQRPAGPIVPGQIKVKGSRISVDEFLASIEVAMTPAGDVERTRRIDFTFRPAAPAGQQTIVYDKTPLTMLTPLVEQASGYEAKLRTGEPIDFGPFRGVVTRSNATFVDASDATAFLIFSVQVLEVTDPKVSTWRGHALVAGAEFTIPGYVPLPGRAP